MMDYLPFEISMENRYLSKISRELEIMNDNKGNNSPKIIESNDGILEKKQRFNELLMFDSIPKDIWFMTAACIMMLFISLVNAWRIVMLRVENASPRDRRQRRRAELMERWR